MGVSERAVKNTAYLYVRMIISMFVGLYSVRLVLNALGEEDYGIFNLIGGVIAMFTFLNGAMIVSTQRYLSYYIGKKELNKLSSVFQSSLVINFLISIIMLVIMQVAFIFLFDGFLNIEVDRIGSAKIVYQTTVFSAFFIVNAITFDAAIIAHEDIHVDAIVGILEALLKLGVAISLLWITDYSLEIYSGLLLLTIIISRLIKVFFCYYKYPEYKFKKYDVSRSLVIEMLSFAGWNTFGAACGIFRQHGLAIILNLFYGTVINASFGISNQINGQVKGFSENMLKALRPQIISSEGEGNRVRMLDLSLKACKYSFLLLFFIILPIVLEMETILTLWLGTLSKSVVIFCKLTLLLSLVNTLTVGLQTAQQSIGNIKLYQSIIGGVILTTPIFGYLVLKSGGSPQSVLYVAILIEFLACCLRILYLNKFSGLSLVDYLYKVLLPIIFIVLIGSSINIYINGVIHLTGFIRVLLVSVISSISLIILVYFIGMDVREKSYIHSLISRIKI
ncbi:MATE family efflux transporter [Saccharicrinis aurantiacus]|uniref:hypothetical protein n=1 Tax=Saccharicrinis aurantiacus TaxID=1849719 RepID=UPI00094F92DD|nr:hypothetical protein [Saccharicrinis aurantiacus]